MPALPPSNSSPPPLPLWIRALLAAERAAQGSARAATMLRDELLLACVPPARRDEVSAALLARQRTYSPGGATFEAGLLAWEREMLAHEAVPRAGTVLVGGAGGGREMRALRTMGYDVVGIEPVEALARDAASHVAGDARATVLRGGYADVARLASGAPGPLDALRERPAPDVVLLGWGSLMHVREDDERLALFRALRALAPAAPVLVSFDDYPALDPPGSRMASARRALRRALAALGAPARARDDERFLPWAGFLRGMSAEQLAAVSRASGYRVAWVRGDPGRAVLVPEGESRGEGRT